MNAPSRLPNTFARFVLVSGEYLELANRLESHGIKVLRTNPDPRLPAAVQWHPDMQLCVLKGRAVTVRGNPLRNMLEGHGIPCTETVGVPRPTYPGDALCNVLVSDGWAMGNENTADRAVRLATEELGLKWIHVRQGYAACSTALVNRSSAITEDPGVASALEGAGVEVLRLAPGGVMLPGYEYGFFGGCCGLLAPNLMVFAGRLSCHPQGVKVKDFLSRHGIQVLELLERPLLDVGGIVALA